MCSLTTGELSVKCEKCNAEGGNIRPTCAKPDCPNLNLIDLIPIPLPVSTQNVEDVGDVTSDIFDLFS